MQENGSDQLIARRTNDRRGGLPAVEISGGHAEAAAVSTGEGRCSSTTAHLGPSSRAESQ